MRFLTAPHRRSWKQRYWQVDGGALCLVARTGKIKTFLSLHPVDGPSAGDKVVSQKDVHRKGRMRNKQCCQDTCRQSTPCMVHSEEVAVEDHHMVKHLSKSISDAGWCNFVSPSSKQSCKRVTFQKPNSSLSEQLRSGCPRPLGRGN